MEPSIASLLGELSDQARPVEPMFTSAAWKEVQGQLKQLTLDDSLAMIAAAGGSLRLDGGGAFDPNGQLILFAVGANPKPECTPALLAIADTVPASARAQLVRSMLEVAVRANDLPSAKHALDLLDWYAAEGLELTPLDTPLYWIVRQPVFPETVLPWLAALAEHHDLLRAIEEVRSAYRAADMLKESADDSTSLLTPEQLRAVADPDPAELVFLTSEQISTRIGDRWTHVYESVMSMPRLLSLAWSTWGVEADVLNGGLNQYFWNSAGQFAVEAVEGLDELGLKEHANTDRALAPTQTQTCHLEVAETALHGQQLVARTRRCRTVQLRNSADHPLPALRV